MARKGATLKTIKTVQSHIHALGQCRNMIRKLGLKTVVGADTAGSARQIAEAGDKRTRRSPRASLRRFTASRSSPKTSRMKPTTPRASSCSRARRTGCSTETARRHHVRIPRAQRARRALQGARRICHQRREHDEARVLSARRQLPRYASSMPTSRVIPTIAPVKLALEELAFYSQGVEDPRRLSGASVPPRKRRKASTSDV